MHYNAWEAEVGSPRRHSATKSRLFYAHSLVRPPAEPFPRPGRSTSAPARAANANDGALAPPQGSSLTGASTTASSRRRGEEVATSSRPSFTPPASLAKCVLLLSQGPDRGREGQAFRPVRARRGDRAARSCGATRDRAPERISPLWTREPET